MLQDNPELGKTYNVVKKFKLDGGKQDGVYNIYLADKDFDSDKSNLYTDDLKKLANPGYSKVEDPIENLRISKMFNYLNLYSFLQTGLNKTKLNFTNVVDYNNFLSILENESKNFISALEKNGQGILSNFYEMFLNVNDKNNQDKNRFKDYISDMELNTVEPTETTDVETGVIDTTNMDTEVVEKRLGLRNTEETGVYTYNDSNATNTFYYSNISKNNPDVVFLHNTSVFEIRPEQKDNGVVLGGSSYFMTEVGDMSINFPTDLYSHIRDGRKVELPPSEYDNLKRIWENRIATVKKIQEKNGKIAFPEYGLGDKKTMPQELFVYLSKRLFKEFQFVNPGSTKFEEINKMVGIMQGITDEEILLQLELEEDPFKCK
jgi:hypothetical protein